MNPTENPYDPNGGFGLEKPYDPNEGSGPEKPVWLSMARFEEGTGKLILTEGGEPEIRLHGEVVIVSSGFGDTEPVIDALRRLVLWTDPVEKLEGVLSMGGSAEKFMTEPATSGELAPLDMRIYYPLLSQLEPAFVESDAVYPQLAMLRGRLLWQLGERIDETSFTMQIEVILDEPVVTPSGAIEIKQISLDPIVLTFVRLEEVGEGKPPAHRSLVACTSSTLNSTGSNSYYELKMRFVNLSSSPSADLEVIAGQPGIIQQLVDSACKVWWAKGGIKIVPDGILSPPTTWQGGAVSMGQEQSLGTMQSAWPTDAVEVYLVDQLTDRPGGGVTYDCGTDNAFVIIDVGQAAHNTLLLAHEAGHALGLMHPDGKEDTGTSTFKAGSTGSVMVVDTPNSGRNTSDNLNLIAVPNGQVLQTNGTGGWRTDDIYEHYIRNFPHDDGFVPSVPELPATDWGTHSDVWNYNQHPETQVNPVTSKFYYDLITELFDGADNFPNASEPSYNGPNYMYVRLRAPDFDQPVSVYLFLAVPGSANEPLILLPVTGASNPLTFESIDFPLDGTPVTKYVEWKVPQDPIQPTQLYPQGCCVFAVAYSSNDPSATEPLPHIIDIVNDVIAHPNNSQYRYDDLHDRLASDNNIAQRNLNII